MKALIALASFVAVAAQAQTMTCSYAGVNVVTFNGEAQMTVLALSEDDQMAIEATVDAVLDCNEGVEVMNVVRTEEGASMNVVCYADSLGMMTDSLAMVCK